MADPGGGGEKRFYGFRIFFAADPACGRNDSGRVPQGKGRSLKSVSGVEALDQVHGDSCFLCRHTRSSLFPDGGNEIADLGGVAESVVIFLLLGIDVVFHRAEMLRHLFFQFLIPGDEAKEAVVPELQRAFRSVEGEERLPGQVARACGENASQGSVPEAERRGGAVFRFDGLFMIP